MKESQGRTEMATQNTTVGVLGVTIIMSTTILSPVHCGRWWRLAREDPAYTSAKVSLVASY